MKSGNLQSRWRVMVLMVSALMLVIGGCAAKGAKTDEMTLAQQRAEAERLRKKIRYQPGVYNPGIFAENRQTEDDSPMSRAHEKAAAGLETFTKNSCAKFPAQTRKLCPLTGTIESIDTLNKGVRIFFKKGKLPLEAVYDHLKCHHLYGRSVNFKDLDTCPMHLKYISIEKSMDNTAIDITADNPDTVEAIQDRTKAHMPPA